jgi:hypothetical protein
VNTITVTCSFTDAEGRNIHTEGRILAESLKFLDDLGEKCVEFTWADTGKTERIPMRDLTYFFRRTDATSETAV